MAQTISHLAPKIWEQVPEDIKDSSSLDIFKRKIKSWIPNSCPCKICKLYIPDIGCLNTCIYIFIFYFLFLQTLFSFIIFVLTFVNFN